MTSLLRVADGLPPGLIERDATRLHELLSGPTLLHLPGRRSPALFVSVLLHGNETGGWDAVRDLLRRHGELPRSLALLIGNVSAAARGVRRLDGQPDYNRVWKGGDSPEAAMAREVVERMRARGVFASVDVHNNSGSNPHYACVPEVKPAFLHLAALFGRTVVYFRSPDTAQAHGFAALCPAVTLECGRPGQPHGVEHAADYIRACLRLEHLPTVPMSHADVDVYHTVATVTVPSGLSMSFDGTPADLRFEHDLDRFNFMELPAGTAFARVTDAAALPLVVTAPGGAEVAARFFTRRENEVVTRVPVMPSMLSCDPRIVRQDCLGYLMERYKTEPDEAR